MISILIVNWNVRDLLRACLVSLRTFAASTHSQHIVVVDNASSDGTVEMLHNEFPEVHCIANTSNRGFTGGNNDGLAWIEKYRQSSILNPQFPHNRDKGTAHKLGANCTCVGPR